jgi:hypothetical protein
MPLQKMVSERFNDKIKTVYLVPISTHLDTDELISDSLTVDMFNNITGEILDDRISEKYDNLEQTNIINYMT